MPHVGNHPIVRTKKLEFEDVIGEQVKQTVVRGLIDLDELQKLPVEQIIDVFTTARITEQRTVDGKVVYEGEVDVKVLYEGKAPDQPVIVAEITLRFSDFVDIDDALPTDRLFVRIQIEDVNVRIENQTQLAVTVVVAVKVKVVRMREKVVIVDVKGVHGIKVKRELLRLRRLLAESTRQVLLREIENLQQLQKPPFVQLIDVFSTARITSIRIIDDKVLFEGVVEVKILYASPDQRVIVLTQEDTFSDFVDLPGARPGMEVDLSVDVELVTVEAEDRTNDGNKETVIKTIVIRVNARVFEQKEVKVVTDIRGVPPHHFQRQLIRVEDLIGVAETQVIVKERLDPKKKKKPCVVQIIDCRAFPRITEVRVIDDKIVVLGRVEIKVIYAAKKQTVHVLRGDFPFQGFADVPGARPGQTEFTTVRVLDVRCVIPAGLTPDELKCPPVEATVVLVAETRLTDERQLKVVTKVDHHVPRGIGKGVVIADRVNVRAGPGTTFPVLAQVSRGTKVIVLAEVNDWFKVFIPSLKLEGFIAKRFVRFDKPLG